METRTIFVNTGLGIDPATQYVVFYASDFTAAVVSREKAKLLEDKYGVSLPDNMIIYPNTNFKFSTLLKSVGISNDDIERYDSYLVLAEDELYIDVTDFAYREIPEDNVVIKDIETGMEYARMAQTNPEMFTDMLKSIDVRNSMKYLIGLHAVTTDMKYDKQYKKMNGFIRLIEKYFTCGATLYRRCPDKDDIKEYIDTIEKNTVFKYTKKEKNIIIKELLDIRK